MENENRIETQFIKHPSKLKKPDNLRKSGINKNKKGSVYKGKNNEVYVDFMYFGVRVRESSRLQWNQKNRKNVRDQLDRIILAIKDGSFKFTEVFPNCNNKYKELILKKEIDLYGNDLRPNDVSFNDYVWSWYDVLKGTGAITSRTLGGYRGYMTKYLIPFFGDMPFSKINRKVLDKFVLWAKEQKFRGKPVRNSSIRKYLLVLKMICKDVPIEYGWSDSYAPFFGFKWPKDEKKPYENVNPFSIDEQALIISKLPYHWKPFFKFAFASGLSQGEQIALKLKDINWEQNIVTIQRAMTRDENEKTVVGQCKNEYRKRTIQLSKKMVNALKEQKEIYDKFNFEYFFCTETGKMFDASNIRIRVWIPALKKAKVKYREMKQTRHSFATYHLAKNKDPLTVAKFMGHVNAEMVIKVYAKYIRKGNGVNIND